MCVHTQTQTDIYSIDNHNYTGVYISRSSYVRPGERSLDLLYKPFHTVIYYRYLRFFADGKYFLIEDVFIK